MREILTAEQAEAVRVMSERLGGPRQGEAAAPAPRPTPPAGPLERRRRSATAWCDDRHWSEVELRWAGGAPLLDLANALRVLERHPEFAGRFGFIEAMGKVSDRGKIMMGWEEDALCAVVQERFLPGLPETTLRKALVIAANRTADGETA